VWASYSEGPLRRVRLERNLEPPPNGLLGDCNYARSVSSAEAPEREIASSTGQHERATVRCADSPARIRGSDWAILVRNMDRN